MKCKCNAKPLLQPVIRVFRTTFTMPGRNPPASTRRGKGFMKAETTTLLKVIERILPIDAEGWTGVHDIFNSKHSPRGVEGLKRKFNKHATASPHRRKEIAQRDHHRRVHLAVAVTATARQLDGPCE